MKKVIKFFKGIRYNETALEKNKAMFTDSFDAFIR
jgi:hypothetical protein